MWIQFRQLLRNWVNSCKSVSCISPNFDLNRRDYMREMKKPFSAFYWTKKREKLPPVPVGRISPSFCRNKFSRSRQSSDPWTLPGKSPAAGGEGTSAPLISCFKREVRFALVSRGNGKECPKKIGHELSCWALKVQVFSGTHFLKRILEKKIYNDSPVFFFSLPWAGHQIVCFEMADTHTHSKLSLPPGHKDIIARG